LHHLMTVSEAVVMAAKARQESRGAHSRIDHLEKKKEWGTFNHVVKKGENGEMEIRREPIPQIRQELQDIIEEQG
jgi:succinate dehydrogenase flavoprotein subunit